METAAAARFPLEDHILQHLRTVGQARPARSCRPGSSRPRSWRTRRSARPLRLSAWYAATTRRRPSEAARLSTESVADGRIRTHDRSRLRPFSVVLRVGVDTAPGHSAAIRVPDNHLHRRRPQPFFRSPARVNVRRRPGRRGHRHRQDNAGHRLHVIFTRFICTRSIFARDSVWKGAEWPHPRQFTNRILDRPARGHRHRHAHRLDIEPSMVRTRSAAATSPRSASQRT